ncbi:MAG TPA: SLBB domain-containing protein [Trichocoleus sp.]
MTRFRPYPLLPASTGWIVVSLITLSTLSPGYAQTVDQYSDSLPLIGDQRSEVNWTANYRLGPGDVVKVDIFGAPEYSGEAPVLQDGTVNLLRVGRVAVQGLTFEQAATAIATSFGTYIRRPVITVSPVSLRPIRIAVSGEVNRPGAYSIETSSENQDFDFPSLTEAISQAGGITAQANLKEVEIRRSISPNQKQVTTINLWDLIKTGDLNQDVVLQGGDEVYIPTATALSPEESTELASASFAPTSIKVYVAGEVEQPGLIEVPLNTPLNQAVLIAGGFNRRADQRAVKLVRLNPNGSVTEREVPVDFSQGIGEESNPILMPQDIVVVRRSGAASVGDTTDLLLNPVTRILNTIFGITNLLF